MLNLRSIFLILFSLLLSCSRSKTPECVWTPEQPGIGDSITISYNMSSGNAKLAGSTTIKVIYEFTVDEKDSIVSAVAQKDRHQWRHSVSIPEKTSLICFKFEDEKHRTDDNKGRGWAVPVMNEQGQYTKGTNLKIARILLGDKRPAAFPDIKNALEYLNAELKAFPDNAQAWLYKWMVTREMHGNVAKIKRQLDSLLTVYNDRPEFRWLSIQAKRNILQNQEAADNEALRLIKEWKSHKQRESLEYEQLLIQNRSEPSVLLNALKGFLANKPSRQYEILALSRLWNLYFQLGNQLGAKHVLKRLVELDKNDLESLLTLAAIEIHQGNFLDAGTYLSHAQAECDDELILLQNPWVPAGKREIQKRNLLSQIHSAAATMEEAIDHIDSAISHRQKVLNYGTPFPAYEWTKLGNLYIQKNDTLNAKNAYIKALIKSSDYQDAKSALCSLFPTSLSGNAIEDSVEALIAAKLQAQVVPAPAFNGRDLFDNKIKLTKLRGKIVVLNFWNTWSPTCEKEIPALNDLVEIYSSIEHVVFFAISTEYKNVIANYLSESQFKYQQLYNGDEIIQAFNIVGYPTHVIIDQHGNIWRTYTGFTPDIKSKLQKEINHLLRNPKALS